MLRDEALPIEVAPRRELCQVDGATVARVEDYPVYSLAVQGERTAEVAFVLLRELHPILFNLVLSQGEVI